MNQDSRIAAGASSTDDDLWGRECEIEAWFADLRHQLGYKCLSDYCFSNLFLFRRVHTYHYSRGALPCVGGVTYDGFRHLMPLFDPREVDPEILLRRLDGYDFYYPIAEGLLGWFDRRCFQSSASSADADYLYPAANFRDYPGRDLRKKRALMFRFRERYLIETCRLERSSRSDARAVLDGWMREKEMGPGEADQAPCTEALEDPSRFALEGFIHYADGMPAGFLLAERLACDTWVIRFAKGLGIYSGIYQYMFCHFCKSRESTSYWINFEQDLGLPNFRRTKLSYRPAQLLAKYRVTPKISLVAGAA